MSGGADETDPSRGPLPPRLESELPRLRAYARRLAGPADAEDLVQEVLARALRYAASFDPARAPGPWLRALARRVCSDQRARSLRLPQPLEHEPEARGSEHARVELREDLRQALAWLSPIERDVLVRFHGRGECIREIARDLGLPEGTVKSHLHRARRRLAEDA